MGGRIRGPAEGGGHSHGKQQNGGGGGVGGRHNDEEAQHLLGGTGITREKGEEPLSELCTWSYGVGHVCNDASAACWFSYLLIFLERARNLTAVHAGLVMFSGQFFDALATPAAGFLSDVTPGFPKQGCDGRMLWYIIGTVLAMVSFMGVFAFSPFASSMDSGWCVVYFAVCASLFNVGWAAVQVCHLAMIPELTHKDTERVRLVKLRYAFTILSNLSVFLLYLHGGGPGVGRFRHITGVVLTVGCVCSCMFVYGVCRHNVEKIRREEEREGEMMTVPKGSLGVSGGEGVGRGPSSLSSKTSSTSSQGGNGSDNSSYNSFTFDGVSRHAPTHTHAHTHTCNGGGDHQKEGDQEDDLSSLPNSPAFSLARMEEHAETHTYTHTHTHTHTHIPRKWHDWFKIRDFYLCGMVYMCARIVVNITQVYIMFYLLDTLGLGDRELALVPLTLYLSGLATTFLMEKMNMYLGRKGTYLAGGMVVCVSSFGFHLLVPQTAGWVYVCVCVLGVGSTTMMITAHSMANDLVAEHASGGFLFGIYSTLDKLSNGVLIMGIQLLKQTTCPANDSAILNTPAADACSLLLRRVMVHLPILSVLFSVAASFFISTHTHTHTHTDGKGQKKGSPRKGLYKYSSFVDPSDQSWVGEQHEWSDFVI